jgi:hypothetical protein
MAYTTSPEPVASWTNIVNALQKEEVAIHATTSEATATAILAAVDQLDHAAKHWDAAGNTLLAARTRTAAAQTRIYAEKAAKITSPGDLAKFQGDILYPFQGQLGDLLYAAQVQKPLSPLVLLSFGTALLSMLLGICIMLSQRGYPLFHNRPGGRQS